MLQLNGWAYTLERDGRTVYCSSPGVVTVLLSMGWRLSSAAQLATLDRELAAGSPCSTEGASD